MIERAAEDETGLTIRQLGPFIRAFARSQGIDDSQPVLGSWCLVNRESQIEVGLGITTTGYCDHITCEVAIK